MRHFLFAGFAALSFANAAGAQTVLSGDHSVAGDLCVGTDCSNSESFGNFPLKLKDKVVGIHFEDTSTALGEPTHDWRLLINDSMPYGNANFAVQDGETGLKVFTIAAYAQASALYIDDGNYVGFGTSMPQAHLHVKEGDTPALRLEQDGTGGFDPYVWEMTGNELFFRLGDQTASTFPIRVETGSGNDDALVIEGSGEIGFGLTDPTAALHLRKTDGSAQLKIEEINSTGTPRTLLNLLNNGRPEIVMGNTNTDGEWSFGAGTNFVLKQGAVGTDSSVKTKLLTLYGGNGNLEITGKIITGGPTCSTGCDAVFSDEYDLPSISDHAEQMFALGHLPNVGPTGPDTRINVTDKLGRMLNELEHAHIFIAQQEGRIATLQARDAQSRARIARLEALVEGLVTRQD